MAQWGDAVGNFQGAPSGSGSINEIRNGGWRYTGNQNEPNSVNGWAPPANYEDALRGNSSSSQPVGNVQPSNPVQTFQSLQQAQQQANQPAIAQLQQREADLPTQYSNLIAQIKGQYQPLMNQAITNQNNVLASRGILSQSGMGANQISQAQQAIQGQESGIEAGIGQNEIGDLNQLAGQVASLQTGANAGALTATTGITSSQQQANASIQAAQAQLQGQLASAAAQKQAAEAQALQAQTAAKYITPGLFNTDTKSLVGIQSVLNNYVYRNGQWYQKG